MPPSKQSDDACAQAISSRTDIEILDIASDRLNGAEAIAAFRGEPLHRTRYLIRIGAIPVAREGERIVASKRVLSEHWRKATSQQSPSQRFCTDVAEALHEMAQLKPKRGRRR